MMDDWETLLNCWRMISVLLYDFGMIVDISVAITLSCSHEFQEFSIQASVYVFQLRHSPGLRRLFFCRTGTGAWFIVFLVCLCRSVGLERFHNLLPGPPREIFRYCRLMSTVKFACAERIRWGKHPCWAANGLEYHTWQLTCLRAKWLWNEQLFNDKTTGMIEIRFAHLISAVMCGSPDLCNHVTPDILPFQCKGHLRIDFHQ